MRFKIPTAVAKAGVVVLASATAVVASTSTAWASHNLAGLALIVNSSAPGAQNLNSGGSSTIFGIKLPSESACSGDTANQGYKVFSYLVDATAYPDPGALAYDGNGPLGNGTDAAYSLYTTGGSPYNSIATAPTSGFIINIPEFDFRAFSIDGRPNNPTYPEGTFTLPTGTYNLGIACGNPDNTTDKYFNTQVTFAPSATDPNGMTWSTVPNPQIPDSPLTVLLPLSAAALGGAAFVAMRRRRSSSTVAAA